MAASRIYFLGNCQTNAVSGITRDLCKEKTGWGSITEFWGKYDPDETDAALREAEIVVAQAVPNIDHRYSAVRLREMLGNKLVLHPYIYLDGIASLELVQSKGESVVKGSYCLERHSDWPNKTKLLRAYADGDIDMDQQYRLDSSLEKLKEAESLCDVVISDYIEETLKDTPPLYAINHPSQHIVFEMFRRVSDIIDLSWQDDQINDPIIWAKRALPKSHRAFSMHDVRALGLRYPCDSHWYPEASKLITIAVNKRLNQ